MFIDHLVHIFKKIICYYMFNAVIQAVLSNICKYIICIYNQYLYGGVQVKSYCAFWVMYWCDLKYLRYFRRTWCCSFRTCDKNVLFNFSRNDTIIISVVDVSQTILTEHIGNYLKHGNRIRLFVPYLFGRYFRRSDRTELGARVIAVLFFVVIVENTRNRRRNDRRTPKYVSSIEYLLHE